MRHPHLAAFVDGFSKGLELADSRRPQKVSRKGTVYQEGIGPFTEDETVSLVLNEMEEASLAPFSYQKQIKYPDLNRQHCDLLLESGATRLFVEVKMMRLFGDNGKPNDNIFMHILSPYPRQNSALTDVAKLRTSGFGNEKSIVIYGYDYEDYPLDEMMECFEKLAGDSIGERHCSTFNGLVHPVHQRGATYGWMVTE